ncbi:serine hydrolase [Sphingomonas sabuli]|uniref:Serine hydrolase n=1 Tax=Sphingomonas sabuli TaxID=2764186 RepID=A0A7G9L203_9SPHN|nr:serine hydrolase [Sphingomonas sabuli]QNM82652.1 serine hydrolase [Sphingomonas sabuli]
MIQASRRDFFILGGMGVAAVSMPALAQSGEPAIDAIVRKHLDAFAIPGASVAIIRPGQPVFTRGYGVREMGKPALVDSDTQFAIASNSKSFTGALLAMLVEDKKIGWDEPVVTYLPEFKMSDPEVTRMVTVRDLLVHRSGLALGAGDLMQFPTSDRTAAEVLNGLQYLPLARGFRSGYAYDNILYIVAGLLIERVSGQSWGTNVRDRIFRPLGMRSLPFIDPANQPNVAGRHARLGPPVRGIGPQRVIAPDEGQLVAPAGGIQASARDIARWLEVQLGKGQVSGGPRLWSEAQAKEMWTPQVITSSGPGPSADEPTRSVMSGYALGWFVQQYRSRRLIAHSGGLSGQVTHTAFFPEDGIAVAAFTNAEDGYGAAALRNALLDHLVGAPPFDWVAWGKKKVAEGENEVRAALAGGGMVAKPGGPTLPLDAYAGRYRDRWYGDVVVARRADGLHIDFTRSPPFKSRLEPFGPDTFRTHFPEGAGEDALVTFVVEGGKTDRITMKALSPLADFSYDFHDLAFERVK